MQQPERYEPMPSLIALPAFLWRRLGRRGRTLAAALLLAIAAAAAATVPALIGDREHRDAATRAERADAARERRALVVREQRARTGRAPVRGVAVVSAVERAITEDARARHRAGVLAAPARRTVCAPRPGAGPGGLAPGSVVLTCLAVTGGDRRGRTRTGQTYQAAVHARTGRYAFCRAIPATAEEAGTRPPLPAVCRERDARRERASRG